MPKTEYDIDTDKLNEMLQPAQNKEKTELDVLKELFTLKNIESKTELTIGQIILINQKRTISKLLDWDSLDSCLNDFMILMISNQRKGRAEFVDGFKSDRDRDIQKSGGGFFSSMKSGLGFK